MFLQILVSILHIMKNRVSFLLVIGLVSVSLFSGCNINQQTITTPTWDINSDLLEKIPITPENDFSGLDRSIVNQPISFEECTTRSGNKTEVYWDDPNYIICKVGNNSFHKFKDRPEEQGVEKYIFWKDDYIIKNILGESDLSITGQNSLIEIFNKHKMQVFTGTLKYAEKDRISDEKAKITLSGEQNFEYITATIENNEVLLKGKLNEILTKQRKEDKDKDDEHIEFFIQTSSTNIKVGIEESWNIKIWEILPITNLWYDNHFQLVKRRYKYTKIQETSILLEWEIENLNYTTIKADPKYCFKYICFNPQRKIFQYKDWLIQENTGNDKYGEEEYTSKILMNIKEKVWILQESYMMSYTLQLIQEHNDYIVYKREKSGCMSRDIGQYLSVKEELPFPKKLHIFGEVYELQDTNISEDLGYNSHNEQWYNKGIVQPFKNQKHAEIFLTQDIKDTKKLYNTYIIRFWQYPDILLKYSNTSIENPEAVFFSEQKIPTDEQNNVINLETTKKIYCSLRHRWVFEKSWEKDCKNNKKRWYDQWPQGINDMMFFDETKEKTFDKTEAENSREQEITPNEKILPLYKVKKTKEKDRYTIYPAEWVHFDKWWAGCKPVLYLYDNKQRENKVSITLPTYWSFTKLIPDFDNHNQDKTNTRTFTTDKNSNIIVDWQEYPYLYYSTLRANYKNNPLARIVAYDDIEFFLNDKLDKMNFNKKEKADFLEYWLPEFKPGYVYWISFKFNEEFSPYAQLTFKYSPKKIFRMFMEAHQYPISKHITFDKKAPNRWDSKLLKSFERGSDFDILERGGKLEKIRR